MIQSIYGRRNITTHKLNKYFQDKEYFWLISCKDHESHVSTLKAFSKRRSKAFATAEILETQGFSVQVKGYVWQIHAKDHEESSEWHWLKFVEITKIHVLENYSRQDSNSKNAQGKMIPTSIRNSAFCASRFWNFFRHSSFDHTTNLITDTGVSWDHDSM